MYLSAIVFIYLFLALNIVIRLPFCIVTIGVVDLIIVSYENQEKFKELAIALFWLLALKCQVLPSLKNEISMSVFQRSF